MPEIIPTSLTSTERSDSLGVNYLSPLHCVIMFHITTLGVYLQVEFQGKVSPFDEHCNIKLAVILSLFIYVIGLMMEYKLQAYNSSYLWIIRRFSLLTGALVAILLTALLIPLLGLVAFILWTLLLLKLTLDSYQHIIQWFHQINPIMENCFSGKKETNDLPVREENSIAAREENDNANGEENPLPCLFEV